MKLNPEIIPTLPAGRHSDGHGLYLQVLPSGSKSWLFRYQRAGRAHGMGLGAVKLDDLPGSIAKAREQAAEARELLARGEDPIEARRARKPKAALPTKSFADCATAYVEAHRSSWKSLVHARQWDQILDQYVLPKIGRVSVADVSPDDVERVLAPLWKTRPEVARKTAGKIGLILDTAIARGLRSAPNVASLRVMTKLLGPLPRKRRHHPAIPYADLPKLMAKLDGNDIPTLAFKFLVLTATRSSEARCATWSELDLEKAEWTIPAARMKGGTQHTVPLSTGALELLARVPRTAAPYVFATAGGMPVSETSLRNLLRANGITKDKGSLHGCRSSFRDWAAETGIDDGVAEFCLAHYSKGIRGTLEGSGASVATMRAYKRTTLFEARREAMEAWSLFVS